MKAVYPAILTPEKVGYSVVFPDIAGGTQGDTLYEALEMAESLVGFMLTSLEEGEEIPEPTPLEKIEVAKGSFVTLIKVDTAEYLQKEAARQAEMQKSESVA